MDIVKIKVLNTGKQRLPEYKTSLSAGMDLRADINEPYTLQPLERHLFPTGLHIQLPEGYEAQIRPRSGLALKNGITVLNTPGTIDADYINNIGVILINLGDKPFIINPGNRIAQMIIAPYSKATPIEVDILNETERHGGFGHTGIE